MKRKPERSHWLLLLAITLTACNSGEQAQAPAANALAAKAPAPPLAPLSYDETRAIAKELHAEITTLFADLSQAARTSDVIWYQRELKTRPWEITHRYRARMAQSRQVDSAFFASCFIAADRLANLARYVFDQPSPHYRAEFLREYENQIAECKTATESETRTFNDSIF